MQYQFDISLFSHPVSVSPPAAGASESAELLRQLLEVQRQQLALLQASAAAHDTVSRWRAFMARWNEDFPDLAESSREVVPLLERTYGTLITELVSHLRQDGADALDNDFALQEFLDRYGMRLAQLGTLLHLLGPLAEAAQASESA